MAIEHDFTLPSPSAVEAEAAPLDSRNEASDTASDDPRTMQAALRREQEVFRQWLEVEERTRQRTTEQIHDEIAQPLIAAMMNLETLQAGEGGAPFHTALRTAADLLRQGLAASRRLMSGLRPTVLDELGLAAALEHFVHDCGGAAEVEIACDLGEEPLAAALEAAAFRIAQEGLSNALRYSGSDSIQVEIARRGPRLHVTIEDRGVGFDQKGVSAEKFGLKAMRARARLFGGYARIHSAPGQGTRIFAELPLG